MLDPILPLAAAGYLALILAAHRLHGRLARRRLDRDTDELLAHDRQHERALARRG